MAYLHRIPCPSDAYISIGTNGSVGDVIDSPIFRYKISSKKFPLWNYSQKMFSAVAQGREIATGMLGINLVSFNYLNAILVKNGAGGASNTDQGADTGNVISGRDVYSSGIQPTAEDPRHLPVLKNTPGINIRAFINSAVAHASLGQSYLEFMDVRFLDEETAFDAKSGEPILQLITFIANVRDAATEKR